jgi:hypothetical protein
MRIHCLGTLLAGGLAACIGNLTPVQRAQDAANEFTTAARFGRADLALERVSPEDRDHFLRRHAAWGTTVRIVDCEIVGLRLKDKEHAEVMVQVSWQRVEESEMRTTHVSQHWRDRRGAWLLDSEERAGGDVGLLGEQTTVLPPSGRTVQFETITIR